ncbi:MAG: CCA tRNA nucleotidyltransferase, partial [Amylibacter sp.]
MSYRFGADAALNAKMIEAATLSSPLPKSLHDDIAEGTAATFPVKAVDLIDRLGAGPHLGAELKRLESLWVNANFAVGKEELLQS